jgi:predicted permease
MHGELARTASTASMAWWERVPGYRVNWLVLVGRLAPGATFDIGEAELRGLWAALEYEGKDPEEGLLFSRQYLYAPWLPDSLDALASMLLAVVGIVLAVAAANVAVLLLSRASTRGRELAVRMAIGAGTGRIVRQLLAESLLLGLGGGAMGVALAYTFADAAVGLLPYRFAGPFVPDGRVLLVAAGLSVLTAVAVGLAPALVSSRVEVVRTMGGAGVFRRRSYARNALIVGQVALSLMLVAAAALFGRSFAAARSQALGWRADHRLVVSVDLRNHGYDDIRGRAFVRDALERIGALPGVTAVTATRMVPFRGDWSTDFDPEPGTFPDAPEGRVRTGKNTVGPGYFDLMEIDILQGRPLDDTDVAGSPPSVVVNETLAGALWPGRSAVGQTLPGSLFPGDNEDFTVVGVARDATYNELGEDAVSQVYSSIGQVFSPDVKFLAATEVDPLTVAVSAQAALRKIDGDLVTGQVTTLAAIFDDQVARYRVSAVLVGLFGAVALVLAATGLYGVVSFVVARRTREIGVRMALGAPQRRVAMEVLSRVVRLTAAGVALGVAGSFAVRRFATSLLYGVAPQDPWPIGVACAALITVMLLAALVPTCRATRIDPAAAIRRE